jgi:hypothetical protein
LAAGGSILADGSHANGCAGHPSTLELSQKETSMATPFLYGPYSFISTFGAPSGAVHSWNFGPWDWYADAVTITAHPFAQSGLDRRLAVSNVVVRAAANGERFISCNVTNVGSDPANYAVWVGGVKP